MDIGVDIFRFPKHLEQEDQIADLKLTKRTGIKRVFSGTRSSYWRRTFGLHGPVYHGVKPTIQ